MSSRSLDDAADGSLSRQGCGYSLDAALANANAALDAAILAAPPPTNAPRPTTTVQPAVPGVSQWP